VNPVADIITMMNYEQGWQVSLLYGKNTVITQFLPIRQKYFLT